MDLFSVLDSTIRVINAVDEYRNSINDAEKSFESLKTKLGSTRELLAKLEAVVTGGNERSQEAQPDSSLDHSILQLIDAEGQLKKLQSTLDEISTWLSTLQLKSKSKKDIALKLLSSSRAKQKRVKQFLSELEEYKLTANLVLTMAIRYEHHSLNMSHEHLLSGQRQWGETRAERKRYYLFEPC